MTGRSIPPPFPAGSIPDGTGLLVVGHGTADRIGADETRRLVDRVRAELPGTRVELGFLEVIGPTVAESLAVLREQGCREIIAVPLLLFTAGHAKRDLPAALAEKSAGDGAPRIRQAGALGAHPQMVALSRRRRKETRDCLAPMPAVNEALVFIGRGASDPGAAAQLEGFLAATLDFAKGHDAPVGRTWVGFVAAARPSVEEALETAAVAVPPPHRVLVQPHLLFSGRVEEQLHESVAAARQRHPAVEWVVVPRLGPEPEVARALIARAEAVVGAVDCDGAQRP